MGVVSSSTSGEVTIKSILKDLFIKTIAPLAVAALLLFIAYWPLSADATGMDLYLKMLFFAGIPFGMKKMCVFIVPFGHDVTATIAILALNFIVGGIIGAFVFAWRMIIASVALVKSVVMLIRLSVVRPQRG